MVRKPEIVTGGDPSSGFFAGMPNWAKGVVFALTTIPVAVALSGQILGVRVGDYLDKYAEIQLEQMRNATGESAEHIIDALGPRLEAIEAEVVGITGRVDRLESWACTHADKQRLADDRPDFCVVP